MSKAVYVEVSNTILDWAVKKAAKMDVDASTYALLTAWQRGEKKPTFKQLESVSRKLQIPFGYFFLQKPPVEHFPMAEFRTVNSNEHDYAPSANLRDTIDDMLNIQEWMRDYVKDEEGKALPYVSSCKNSQDVVSIADKMRKDLHLSEDWMLDKSSAQVSFSFLRERYQNIGILVMMNGVVENNTRRKLDVKEFRAFTLVDSYAPLIFINARDSWNGRVFSLLHEAVHIWLGVNSIYNEADDGHYHPVSKVEQVCNAVAAELLVPTKLFIKEWKNSTEQLKDKLKALAKLFSCSMVVIARKAMDLALIGKKEYSQAVSLAMKLYKENVADEKKSAGGDFYRTLATRLDNRFVRAIAASAESGRTQYTDAYRLTNTNRVTFDKLYKQMESKGKVVGYE